MSPCGGTERFVSGLPACIDTMSPVEHLLQHTSTVRRGTPLKRENGPQRIEDETNDWNWNYREST